MKRSVSNHLSEKRAAVKAAARSKDRADVQAGASPKRKQEANSALSASFFANARILNLSDAIGR